MLDVSRDTLTDVYYQKSDKMKVLKDFTKNFSIKNYYKSKKNLPSKMILAQKNFSDSINNNNSVDNNDKNLENNLEDKDLNNSNHNNTLEKDSITQNDNSSKNTDNNPFNKSGQKREYHSKIRNNITPLNKVLIKDKEFHS
jgi:hypothetical protein